MVESTNARLLQISKQLTESAGPMQLIFSFLDHREQIQVQQLNKRMYEKIIPSMKDVTPFASCQLIFENNRKEIYSANWGISKDLKRKLLIRIGDGPGTFKLADLGIEKGEISFQWFIAVSSHSYIVFPLVEEAHLQEAVRLDFDPNTNAFIKFTKLASAPVPLMRPTTVLANLPNSLGGRSILLVGGTETRTNLAYSIRDNTYRKLA